MTARGKFILVIGLLALVGFGAWQWNGKSSSHPDLAPDLVEAVSPATTASVQPSPQIAPTSIPWNPTGAVASSPLLARTVAPHPPLPPAAPYQPKDNLIEIELSEYAGYAGLIVANGGLEPSENSEFFKKGGFKVKITMSEREGRTALQAGQIAALATTVDVLPVYGRSFQVVTPVQIGFSRGADGLVVRREFSRINHLKGRVLASAQFTEADYFIRFLARKAGLGIHPLPGLKERPDPDQLNLVYCQDAFSAGDLFLEDLREGGNLLAGCVTWAPKTTQVAQQSQDRAAILVTSQNLLIVADILVVNQGFARQHPDKVAALVAGLLEGNRQVRDHQHSCLDLIAKTFGWDLEKTKAELAKVHFSNLPENQAFFSGSMDSVTSFATIYRSAVLAYGGEFVQDPGDGSHFLDLKHLAALEQSGAFTGQAVAIVPIGRAPSPTSKNPLLSVDIRFQFEPNNFTLRLDLPENLRNLEAIHEMLQVSPGSIILLRGHVDNAMIGEFRKKGGDAFVRQMSLRAVELSKHRALEIKRLLVERYEIDHARLKTAGLGWEAPLGADHESNRRVEAQWFTVE